VRFEQHLNEGIGACGEVHFQPRNPVQWPQIEKNHPYFRYSKPSALPRAPAPYREGVPIKSLARPVFQALWGVEGAGQLAWETRAYETSKWLHFLP